MLNKTIMMGRLTKDPELRTTANGTSVVSFSLAVERDYKNPQTGEKDVDFFDCVAWRNQADYIAKYFSKGRMAIVEGKLQTRYWEDKNQNKRKETEINVDNIYFGDSKPESTQSNAPAFKPQAPSQAYTPTSDYEGFVGMPMPPADDDLPF